MKGVYKVLIGQEVKTFYEYDDIPSEFDNLIMFAPEIPEGPHTDEEHEMIEQLNDKMKDVMSREKR
jgi:hypothetical protein